MEEELVVPDKSAWMSACLSSEVLPHEAKQRPDSQTHKSGLVQSAPRFLVLLPGMFGIANNPKIISMDKSSYVSICSRIIL